MKINKGDIVPLDSSLIKKETIIFQTLKLIILKKMWQLASDEDRYNVLLSKECSQIGLNRFPVYSFKDTKSKTIELKNILQICLTSTGKDFSSIAPFISRDVLAEALLNLKMLFPQSFPTVVTSLCESLKNTNEFILQEDGYAGINSSGNDLKSVKDFSNWLNGLFNNYKNREKIEEEEEKLSSKLNSSVGNEYQKILEERYLKSQVKGQSEKPAPYYTGMQIVKNSDGLYVIETTPDSLEKMKKFEESVNTKNLNEMKQKMKEQYESNQTVGQPEVPVQSREYPGFYIVKKNGAYFYTIDKKTKEKVMKAYKQKIKFNKEQSGKFYKTNEGQKILKKVYKKLQEGKTKPEKILGEYFLNYLVVKNNDGTYSLGEHIEFSDNQTKLMLNKNEFFSKELNLDGVKDPVPYSDHYAKNSVIVYDKSNGYFMLSKSDLTSAENFGYPGSKNVGTMMYSNPRTLYGNVMASPGTGYEKFNYPGMENQNPEEFFSEEIKQYYQNQHGDKAKILSLTELEIKEIRSYTGASHVQLNNCLRAENCNEDQKTKIKTILSGLKKLKNKNSETFQIFFRGANWLSEDNLRLLNNNTRNFVLDKGFLSTSGDIKVAKQFAGNHYSNQGVLFILKTKSCVGISVISGFKHEDEFLCSPGMKFNVQRKDSKSQIYILEEVD
ncbi:MAG: ADP-ribosyltransferase [Bacteriovoracaceae bacterium]